MFAELYEGRIEAGLLREMVIYDEPPAPTSRQPEGTRSEVVDYLDEDGRTLARVHRFVNPDGTLGGSGLMDPLELLHDGRIYRVR